MNFPSTASQVNSISVGELRLERDRYRDALERVHRCLRLPVTADHRRLIGVIIQDALNPSAGEE